MKQVCKRAQPHIDQFTITVIVIWSSLFSVQLGTSERAFMLQIVQVRTKKKNYKRRDPLARCNTFFFPRGPEAPLHKVFSKEKGAWDLQLTCEPGKSTQNTCLCKT